MRYLLLLTAFTALQACYYDNEQDLYPASGGGGCDTLNLTYQTHILPIY